MTKTENLFDEDLLLPNMKGAAYFILLYEHFEDVVISVVQEFYSELCILDGEMYSSIDDAYIKALQDKIAKGEMDSFIPYERQLKRARRDRDRYVEEIIRSKTDTDREKCGKRFRGSLKWLQDDGALSEQDVSRVLQIRKRRNDIVHELLKVLSEGLTEEDAHMISDLLVFNHKISVWHFREIDMPALGIELPEGTSPEEVVGGNEAILSGIFQILFLNEGSRFKNEIEKIICRQQLETAGGI